MPNLNIIGVGTNPKLQISQEAIDSIKSSTHMFYLGINEDELPLGPDDFKNRVKFFDLMQFYNDGGKDLDHYMKIVTYILDNLSSDGQNSVIVAGDPRVGVDATRIFESIAEAYDLKIKCISGISSANTILHDISADLLTPGTCFLDVNRIIDSNLKINSNITNIIYHVCSIGVSETHLYNPSKNNNVKKLSDYLLQFYNKDYMCSLVRSSESSNHERIIHIEPLHRLEELLLYVDFSSTLVLPACVDILSEKN